MHIFGNSKDQNICKRVKILCLDFPVKGGDRALFQACTASGLGFWNRAYDYAQDVPKEHDT